MRHARVGSSATCTFTELLKDYPAEKIPIPGPLAPILQNVATCESDNPAYGFIHPAIRNNIGQRAANHLWNAGTMDFVLPNVPLIAAFANSRIHAESEQTILIQRILMIKRTIP